jgi:ankyrin repeat protein
VRRFVSLARLALLAAAASILAAAAGLLGSCATPATASRPAARPSAGTAGRLLGAAGKGDLAAVRRLVEQDPALLRAEDRQGWNALSYAAWAGHQEVYDFLRGRGGSVPLFAQAALGPFPAFVERLKARPAAVRDRDLRERATLLGWSARTGNLEACQYLLSLGAAVDAADRSGDRPLHLAAARDDVELAGELLGAGADPGAAGAEGATPLHHACARGSFALVQLLLDRGAPPAAADREGTTPLHAAAAAGRLEICEYLLLRGASRSTKNRRGLTAGDLAADGGYSRLAGLLKERP